MAALPRSMAQVAAVLAFVISHTTFLAAQDDEMGRCPKVVCKSLVLRFPNHWHVSQLPNQVRSEGTAHKMRKRCGVLKYTVFTKDEKPVNLLNLQNLFNL